ncbi:hypothetical protein ESY86_00245 [Subsaximicrobium wynnwilliamsii]|jgi:uncharacterized membrane protein|uniref:DUF4870 domain-containing protein n=1 Tax=Subsaximicrobium wynnwilliamsii TaxID=291179 RepID=A0A5C6ZN65_9FLAO|nr:hypothetical protein [Subsaximicrobium wynnwilliamsii]TXD85022.1 hypothetical protein ESY87_01415 [Subsaximicrobium wynnwilliamsii]TXD91065.1 hypothetical protein ESY86_00245 [Subsaximicrobium wynnwilliamsii]TXE04459.1 hypothetical protein ESY88_02895 [Subsaximicrobium wynnwilliamsii]
MKYTNAAEEGKTRAIVAYITLIGTLIAYFLNKENNNPFVYFHVRQALGLWLLQLILGYFIGAFDSWMVTTAFWIAFISLFIYGIIGAANGQKNEVPIIGPFCQKLFSSIGN